MDDKKLKELIKEVMEEEEAVEEEPVEEEAPEVVEDVPADEQKPEEAEALVTEEALDKFTNRIVSAIKTAKGLNESDTNEIKSKMFSKSSGFAGFRFPKDLNNLSKEDKIVSFFKSLVMYKEDAEAQRVFKALNEGTAADGGYLVPEELKAEIWRILPDYSVMRKLARIIPMQTDSLKLNSLEAKPAAYWTAEYASKTTSSAEFGQIELTPYKLVCLLPVTQELIADANIDIVRFILELFAEVIAATEDKAYFTGSGTAQPTGLMTSLGTAVDAGNAISFDNVIDLIYSVPQTIRNSRRAAFVAPKNVIKSLRRLKDSNNNYIWSPGQPDNDMVERLYGYRLFEQNDLAHNQMVFGDFSYYIIGDRQQLTVMTTMEGGDAWRRDSMEIKTKIRVDGECIDTNAFAKLINA